jgi:hypothetical protein
VVKHFWPLIHGKINQVQWLAFLDVCLKKATEAHHPSEMRVIEWLQGNLEHYCPELIFDLTGIQVSSRVEGFFGILKQRLGHVLVTLAELAIAIHDLAVSAFMKRIIPGRKPFCAAFILAICDQFHIGDRAAKLVQEAGKLMRSWRWEIDAFDLDAANERRCCSIAKRWKLPCIHLLLARIVEDVKPLLTLRDFPKRVILSYPHFTGFVSHDVVEIAMLPALRNMKFEYAEVMARLEPIVNAACGGDARAQGALLDIFESFNALNIIRPPAGVTYDPVVPKLQGRRNMHPSQNSSLARTGKKGRSTRRKKVACCSRCHQPGHNKTSCPLNRRLAHLPDEGTGRTW